AQRARDRRARRERARTEENELPVRLLRELADEGAQQLALRLAPLEHDDVPLRLRRERLQVDAGGNELVGPREPLRRGRRRLGARREQRVEPAEEPLAPRARRRI